MTQSHPAYLLIRRLAQFNDEWYMDHTLSLEGVNPAGLYASREEAGAAARRLSIQAMRGANFDDLEVDEDTDAALTALLDTPGRLDPALRAAYRGFQSRQRPLPAWLTDEQLGDLLDRTGLTLFHIIDTRVPAFELALAQSLLALTPGRPPIDLTFDHEDDTGTELDVPRQVIGDSDDPAVQRLNRVTRLFGRRYASGLPV